MPIPRSSRNRKRPADVNGNIAGVETQLIATGAARKRKSPVRAKGAGRSAAPSPRRVASEDDATSEGRGSNNRRCGVHSMRRTSGSRPMSMLRT